MTRADLIRILRNTELEEHPNLTREQARAVVNGSLGPSLENMRKGEVARLPFGVLWSLRAGAAAHAQVDTEPAFASSLRKCPLLR